LYKIMTTVSASDQNEEGLMCTHIQLKQTVVERYHWNEAEE